MSQSQALQYVARNKVLSSDGYTKTLTLTGLGSAAAYVLVSGPYAPLAAAVVLAIGLEKYFNQRKNTQQKLKLIDAGDYREHFLDDPESLELVDELVKTVNVPAVPVVETPTIPASSNPEPEVNPALNYPAIAPPISAPTTQPDIVDSILAQGNSLTFIGGQGCGKSRLMAIASEAGLRSGRFSSVSIISSLAKPNEDPQYWQHCSVQAFCDMAPMSTDDKFRTLIKYLKTIQQFKLTATAESPGLLIIDEYAYLASYLAANPKDELCTRLAVEIADVLRVVQSGGAKRGWFVWLGTPKAAISEMGALGRAMKCLAPVFCAIAPSRSAQSRGALVAWDDGLFQQSKVNFPGLEQPGIEAQMMGDRIVFFNGAWMPQCSRPLPQPSTPRSPIPPIPQSEPIQEPVSPPTPDYARDAIELQRMCVEAGGVLRLQNNPDAIAAMQHAVNGDFLTTHAEGKLVLIHRRMVQERLKKLKEAQASQAVN